MDVHSDPARQSPVHLIVMGVTGTGKSTVGEGLAEGREELLEALKRSGLGRHPRDVLNDVLS